MILKRGGLRGRDSKDRSFLIPFHLTLPAAAKRLFAVGSRVRKSKRRKGAQGKDSTIKDFMTLLS